MAYQEALEAAGAKVHEYKDFGSYQGDWYAYVTYKGESGWVHGSYGSCSGCDAFEAEFGWDEHDNCSSHRYIATDEERAACTGCQLAKAQYREKLANFGRPYLEGISGPEPLLKELEQQSEWDSESGQAAAWVRDVHNQKHLVAQQ